MSRRGYNIVFRPFSSKDQVKFLYEDEFKKFENNELKKPYISIVCGIAPQLTIDLEASYNIAYSMFETTEIPNNWVPFYNKFDEVWVPSKFCFKSFNRRDLDCRIAIVPLGVEHSLYQSCSKKESSMFTFLSVGQWIDRKGWDLLIQAYTSEFMGQSNVRLCIKTYNNQKTNEEMIREYLRSDVKNTTYMPRIMIKNQKVDELDMNLFYREADCFVLPSRGEAFCLPFLESMASGVPVIATDFGGQTDFVNEENGWLIKIMNLRHLSERLCKINSAYCNLWFAEPDVKEIRRVMRYVFENREELKEKGRIAKQHVLNNYTWEKISIIAEHRLSNIFKKIA